VDDRAIWYDILGVSPGAPDEDIRLAYQARARLLEPSRVSGAPSKVVTAVGRAQALIDRAWQVLGDPAARRRYDQEVFIGPAGPGLDRPAPAASEPGTGALDGTVSAGGPDMAVTAGGLAALADWPAPHPRPPRRLVVPDFRGLPVRLCLRGAARMGLRVQMVRLTENPMPVEGLVVGQAPRPGERARRSGTLVLEVWHPRASAAAGR
jgi:curved DNA-binding protein CbpA